jgi:hypothetical protein
MIYIFHLRYNLSGFDIIHFLIRVRRPAGSACHKFFFTHPRSSAHSYSYPDPYPLPGVGYYRIKIEDSASNSTYSRVIAIRLGGASPTLSVYPNPVRGSLTVVVPNSASTSEFQLSDMAGQVLRVIPVGQNTQSVLIAERDQPGDI